MLVMLLSAMMITPPPQCHGIACDKGVATALDKNEHGAQADAANSDSDSTNLSKLCLHGGHVHHADTLASQKWVLTTAPLPQGTVLGMPVAALASQIVSPLLEPPSHA